MRKVLLSLGMILVSLALSAQGIPLCKEKPFADGEVVEMSLMYRWGLVNSEVGTVRLSLEVVPYGPDSTLVYHASCVGNSARFFDVFFKIRENFQTWFTMDENRPLEAIRDTYEGGYTAKNHYIYDWPNQVIRADVALDGKPSEHKEIPVKGLSYDIVSLVYHIRSVDWKQMEMGQSVQMPFAIDNDVYDIKLTYGGQEIRNVRRLGNFPSLLVSCTVVAGEMFSGDQELQVWLSDNDRHLPLAVMVPLKVGTVWAYLKNSEGLK